MQTITTCLWFETQAEEAARFYTSIFKNAKMGRTVQAPRDTPGNDGSVPLTVEFEIEGNQFVGLNGGKMDFSFNHAISFQVDCKDQAEVDYYWERLGAGGKEVQCGWLVDRYGLSWQIVPRVLIELYSGPDRAKANRVHQAMMKMVKLDVAALEAAARG